MVSEFTYQTTPGVPPPQPPAGDNRLDLGDSPWATIIVDTRGDDPSVGGGGETKELVRLSTTTPAVEFELFDPSPFKLSNFLTST